MDAGVEVMNGSAEIILDFEVGRSSYIGLVLLDAI